MKYFTIYKITNTLNDKIYIGQHVTDNLDDSYMGSGTHIRASIRTHGVKNFKKEILFVFDNEYDMCAKEMELVTEEFCSLDTNYNISPGGFGGGFRYINANGLRTKGHSREMYERVSNTLKGRQPSEETLNAVRRRHAEGKVDYATFSGKSHSEEAKKKIGEANSKLVGSKNSQFGTMWITDGQTNMKIKKVDIIPEGWYKGRK